MSLSVPILAVAAAVGGLGFLITLAMGLRSMLRIYRNSQLPSFTSGFDDTDPNGQDMHRKMTITIFHGYLRLLTPASHQYVNLHASAANRIKPLAPNDQAAASTVAARAAACRGYQNPNDMPMAVPRDAALRQQELNRFLTSYGGIYLPLYTSFIGIVLFGGLALQYASYYIGLSAAFVLRSDGSVLPVLHYFYDGLVGFAVLYGLSRYVGFLTDVNAFIYTLGLLAMGVGVPYFMYQAALEVTSSAWMSLGVSMGLLMLLICASYLIYASSTIRSILSYSPKVTWDFHTRSVELIIERYMALLTLLLLRYIAMLIIFLLSPYSQNVMPSVDVYNAVIMAVDCAFAIALVVTAACLEWAVDNHKENYITLCCGKKPMATNIPTPLLFSRDPVDLYVHQQYDTQVAGVGAGPLPGAAPGNRPYNTMPGALPRRPNLYSNGYQGSDMYPPSTYRDTAAAYPTQALGVGAPASSNPFG